jgi:hypothetical protein
MLKAPNEGFLEHPARYKEKDSLQMMAVVGYL